MMQTNPEDTQSLIAQARQLFQSGQIDQAIHFLETKSSQHPQNAELFSQISMFYRQIGNLGKALEKGHTALELAPDNVDYMTNLGTFYELNNDLLTAAKYYEEALDKSPGNVLTRCNLVNIYERLNRLDDCEEILAALPDDKQDDAYYVLTSARIKRHLKKTGEAKSILLALEDDKIVDLHHRVLKYNELARICDLQEEYDDAFHYAGLSKQLWREQPEIKRHPPEDIIALLNNLKQVFTRQWVESWTPAPEPKRPAPVQVVGFPRSGTTLIDQILQSHPSIVGMDEKPPTEWLMAAMDKAVNGIFQNIGMLPPETIGSLQQSYFTSCRTFVDFDKTQILLDKNPFSIYKVGPMLRVFPSMKTVVMLRHPLDCILSSYMQNFILNRGTASLATLEQAAQYYDKSFNLLEHYQQVCPGISVYMLRYEDLVENPKEEIKDLLEFLNLPWDESVLNFHDSKRKDAITSASYAQVNQPLYKSSLYRWKNYEKHLVPVRELLQPWIEKFGYEEE